VDLRAGGGLRDIGFDCDQQNPIGLAAAIGHALR
jgi:hypothetical protein